MTGADYDPLALPAAYFEGLPNHLPAQPEAVETEAGTTLRELRAVVDQWQAGHDEAWREVLTCIAWRGGKDQHPDDCPFCQSAREYLAALT